jgi:hypothetical protein
MRSVIEMVPVNLSAVLPAPMLGDGRLFSEMSRPHALMLAVLENAVRCLEHRRCRHGHTRRVAAEAEGRVVAPSRARSPMLASLITLAVFFLVVPAPPARAVFHLARISEVMSGVQADPTVQYVEIRMNASLQIGVANSRITAFNCDGTTATVLLVVPGNVTNQGAGTTWIVGSQSFAAAAGITPDFTWDTTTVGSIPTSCGMVCYGAPGIVPPNPTTWSASDPNQYVDCVAYGGYTGPRKTSTHDGTPASGTPTGVPAGDGARSLTRVSDTQDNLADFSLACPTPMNNAGILGSFGPCTPPATVTTTMVTTTTTTLAGGAPGCSDAGAATATRARIAARCDCTGLDHGAYVKCAVRVVNGDVKAGTLPKSCRGAVKRCAAKSTCGRSGFVACCRTTAKGVRKCSIKKGARGCKAPKGGSFCVGLQTSCCDPCSGPSCAAMSAPTTTPATTTTTRPSYPPYR